MKNKFVLLLIFVSASCSNAPIEGDRKLKGKEVPEFLSQYKKSQYDDVEFYEKVHDKKHSYEVKYEENDNEVSLTFDDKGTLIEREEDISLEDLPEEVKNKILNHLNKDYPGNHIIELEKRQSKDKTNFIDVEIRHHSSSSGYWEVSFTPDGNYISREQENYKPLDTLN